MGSRGFLQARAYCYEQHTNFRLTQAELCQQCDSPNMPCVPYPCRRTEQNATPPVLMMVQAPLYLEVLKNS